MIHVQHVTKNYQSGTTETAVLKGISCDIQDGEFCFIVGPSGSGKSTLLYLMGALDPPTSGEILLDGQSLTQLSAQDKDRLRREQIGFIFQSFNLLRNLSAVENVLVPFLPTGADRTKREAAQELLSQIGLSDRLHHRPNQLSGGEQQRVAIARAILKQPRYVFADEPTGELDTTTGQKVFALLRQLNEEQGTTVITVTHDERYIRETDRVIKILDGKLQA